MPANTLPAPYTLRYVDHDRFQRVEKYDTLSEAIDAHNVCVDRAYPVAYVTRADGSVVLGA